MSIVLRPHQTKFLDDLRASLKNHKCVLGVAPTGFGKTRTGAAMVKGAVDKGISCFFMVPRVELVEQTSSAFTDIGIDHGFIKAGKPLDPLQLAQVVSVDTLRSRLEKTKEPKLLIIDEAHHVSSKTWARIHAWAKASGSFIIGLTGSPWRLDKKGLDMFFTDMVQGPSVKWLIENGFLSQYRIFAPSTPNMDDAGIVAGDFSGSDLDRVMDDKILYGCAVDNWKKLANGLITVAFAPSVKVSQNLAANFQAAGIPAAHLDGGTEKSERRQTIKDFANGKIKVLVNVNLLSEGFDLSAIAGRDVPIQAVILYRPTMSLSLHLQQIGRALRPKAEPAIILDHAGNCVRMCLKYGAGFPDDDFKWSLAARPKKKKKDKDESDTVQQCPECMHVHRPAASCPECGHIYKSAPRLGPMQVEGDLKELSRAEAEQFKHRRKMELIKAKTYEELVALAIERKYKNPAFWSKRILEGREKYKKEKHGRY